jgi:hypothetical protein
MIALFKDTPQLWEDFQIPQFNASPHFYVANITSASTIHISLLPK